MHDRAPSSGGQRIGRLVCLALIVAVAVPAAMLGPPWLRLVFPLSARIQALIGLLRVVQSAYIALLMVLPAAFLILTIALKRAHRRGTPRTRLMRALALCAAMMIGMTLAEGFAAIRLAAMRVPTTGPEAQSLDRPLETRFPDPPGDRAVDVVVLGESSACGVPYHEWLSVGEIVAWKLREAVPDRPFPVTSLARPGYTLDRVHQLLETLGRRPDLVILYAGHNEFSMRHEWTFGVPHYLDEMPPVRVSRVGPIRAHSPVCRLIDETLGMLGRARPPESNAARQLVDIPVYTAANYAERLHDFRVRLEAMTAYCERLGATVVLVIPPGNDADFEPNRSFLPPETTRGDRDAFARDFTAARQLEAADPAGAVAAYRALLDRQPGFAESHFRLARLHEKAGRIEEANVHYIAARDRDGLPVRCTSDFQDVYREVAARHPGAILIDGPAVIRGLSRRGVAGDNDFADGIHPSLIGYTGLAEAILRGLHARRAFGWGEAAPAPIPAVSPSDCARHFGMNPGRWQQVCDYAEGFYFHAAAIRFDPTERKAKQERYTEASRRIEGGIAPDDVGVPGIGTRFVAPAHLAETSAGAWRGDSSR